MTKPADWPRYMIDKRLRDGSVGYYWNPPSWARRQGFPMKSERLGQIYASAMTRAEQLNEYLDDWATGKGSDAVSDNKFGSVDWWFQEYHKSDAFLDLSERTQPDYRRSTNLFADLLTKKGDRLGSLPAKSITPAAVDKAYRLLIDGGAGERHRTANLVIDIVKKAWTVVQRRHPEQFLSSNPFVGLVRKHKRIIKHAVTRDEVYIFAEASVAHGHPPLGAAAIICFEWLQRPENALGGYITWKDYRPDTNPNHIRIEHNKTGQMVWHTLEEIDEDGNRVLFYPEAEAFLSSLPRIGLKMVLRDDLDGPARPYTRSNAAKHVRAIREKIGIDKFTLDACRHGGMTELEEAELTEGQGMALSAHKSPKAYRGYAKRTEKRVLGATRKRRAWVLENKDRAIVRMKP